MHSFKSPGYASEHHLNIYNVPGPSHYVLCQEEFPNQAFLFLGTVLYGGWTGFMLGWAAR
jgi:hypothetical protein